MNEMIAQTEDVLNGQEVNIDIDGDKYTVGLYLRSKSEFTSKTFDSRDAALELYLRLVTAIVKGEASYEERRSWLSPERVRYYSIHRPLGPGAFPKTREVVNIHNFDCRRYVEAIQREAWGYIEYAGELDEKDACNYELVRERA